MYASKKLEVILKLTEVCNIACTYCYYFFSGDDRPHSRPAHIGFAVVDDLIEFINRGFREEKIDSIQIDLHGGEPLMIGHEKFDRICARLRESIIAPLRICLTTNAMLIDENWISVFERHEIAICVSIDGPKAIHDRARVDKKKAGTHERVIAGFKRLQLAAQRGRIGEPAVLCVVTPGADPAIVYKYIVDELGVKTLDFLMPDKTHDTGALREEVQQFMKRLMELWLTDDDSSVKIRTFSSVLNLLTGGRSYLAGFGSKPPLVMTVGSDGIIDHDDFLKPCGIDVIGTNRSIGTSSFADIFESDGATMLASELSKLPDDCLECEFSGACRGGQATHRYSREKRFNNKSVYCGAQYELFASGAMHLLNTGVTMERIAEACTTRRGAFSSEIASQKS